MEKIFGQFYKVSNLFYKSITRKVNPIIAPTKARYSNLTKKNH